MNKLLPKAICCTFLMLAVSPLWAAKQTQQTCPKGNHTQDCMTVTPTKDMPCDQYFQKYNKGFHLCTSSEGAKVPSNKGCFVDSNNSGICKPSNH